MKVLILGGEGYIGSEVFKAIRSIHRVKVADKVNFGWDMDQISDSHLKDEDVVICLAGIPAVADCEARPAESFEENCIKFFRLIPKLDPQIKLIYASSASVYGNTQGKEVNETYILPKPTSEYDKQKQMIDFYMENSRHRNWFGLRFATVNGHSKNPRNRLLINSLVRDAITKKEVTISNHTSFRGILGMKDLCRALCAIIDQEQAPGFYNLASFNGSIEEIGMKISKLYNVPLYYKTGTTTAYSFSLNTEKFQKTFNYKFRDTIDSISKEAEKNDFTKDRL